MRNVVQKKLNRSSLIWICHYRCPANSVEEKGIYDHIKEINDSGADLDQKKLIH